MVFGLKRLDDASPFLATGKVTVNHLIGEACLAFLQISGLKGSLLAFPRDGELGVCRDTSSFRLGFRVPGKSLPYI